jgi:hypothetical protein
MKSRVKLATTMLRKQTIKNLSVAVKKETGPISGEIVVTERSKPGEFPRAEKSTLLRSIFSDVGQTQTGAEGYVGTPLDYGLILETRRNRSFLVRTLQEESPTIRRILTAPMKSKGKG